MSILEIIVIVDSKLRAVVNKADRYQVTRWVAWAFGPGFRLVRLAFSVYWAAVLALAGVVWDVIGAIIGVVSGGGYPSGVRFQHNSTNNTSHKPPYPPVSRRIATSPHQQGFLCALDYDPNDPALPETDLLRIISSVHAEGFDRVYFGIDSVQYVVLGNGEDNIVVDVYSGEIVFDNQDVWKCIDVANMLTLGDGYEGYGEWLVDSVVGRGVIDNCN